MSSNFECFVEICGQRYEIILNEREVTLMLFKDIYPKVQQIVRIALNEDIDLSTHEFELFEKSSTKGIALRSLNKFVENKCVIKIKPKEEQEISSLLVDNHHSTTSSNVLPLINGISHSNSSSSTSTPHSKPVYLISSDSDSSEDSPLLTNDNSNINQNGSNGSNDSNKYNYYCNTCPIIWDKVSYEIPIKRRMTLSEKDFNKFTTFFKKVSQNSDNKYISIKKSLKPIRDTVLKRKFYIYLNKYVEILNESPNRVIACNLYPFFHIFESLAFDSNSKFDQKINAFRQKLRKRLPSEVSLSEEQLFESSLKILREREDDIKTFQSIVLSADIEMDGSTPHWHQICDKYKVMGNHSITSTKDNFEELSHFYAQSYYRLNAKLEPNLQKTFDLLKIIHILDLSKTFAENKTYYQIKAIAEREDLKEYYNKHLRHIRDSKIEAKTVEFFSEHENDIKAFHSMIINTDLRWDCKKRSKDHSFKLLSERMLAEGYEDYDFQKCETEFHKWIYFYAQNYDLLNGKLDEKHQKIFDLLKVIHTLDENKILSKNCNKSRIKEKIIEISSNDEIKDYYEKHLKDIRIKKLKENINASNKPKKKQKTSNSTDKQPNGDQTNDSLINSSESGLNCDTNVQKTNGEVPESFPKNSFIEKDIKPFESQNKRQLNGYTEEVSIQSSNNNRNNSIKLKPILTVFLE